MMPSSDDQLEFHLPAPPVTGDVPLVPARMVNEFVYCPRLAYLMWSQDEWSETGDTVEGQRVHARVDRPNAPLPAPETLAAGETAAADKIVSRSLTLSSATLGVIAKLDVAEAEDGVVTPVDYKRGRRPHVAQGVYEPERIQICLQALLLEEHGYHVERAPSITPRAASGCASCSTTRCARRRGMRPVSCASPSPRAVSRRRSGTARNARAARW